MRVSLAQLPVMSNRTIALCISPIRQDTDIG
jgi:hypothetical protein